MCEPRSLRNVLITANTFQEYLPSVLDKIHPDVILYDAGVDPHEKDELGKLKLSDNGMSNNPLTTPRI